MVVTMFTTLIAVAVIFIGATPSIQVTLTPENVTVQEHGDFILTCAFFETEKVQVSFWFNYTASAPLGVQVSGSICITTSENPYEWNCEENNKIIGTFRNISRSQHRSKWSCSGGNTNEKSNNATIYVQVPIDHVNIINSSQHTITASEQQKTQLKCKSSLSRPVATVDWTYPRNMTPLNVTSEIIKEEANVNDSLAEVESTFLFVPDRYMNGKNLTCRGNTTLDNHRYDWVTLNITYPPNSAPEIEGLLKGSKFSVIENEDSFLNCTIGESNPTAKLEWICDGVNYSVHADSNNSTRLQLKAFRKTHPQCICNSTYLGNVTRSDVVNINVLYPATITLFTANGSNDFQQLDIFENSTVHVICATEGNPVPEYSWIRQGSNYSVSQNLTISNISRDDNNITYSFIAWNSMNDSLGSVKPSVVMKEVTFNVLYPPRVYDLQNRSIVEGNSMNVTCNLDPGNPTHINVTWATTNTSGLQLTITKVQKAHSKKHICRVMYSMESTFGEKRIGNENKSFFLDVLYRPEALKVSWNETQEDLLPYFSVIENETIVFNCFADANPKPKKFVLSGPNKASDGAKLIFKPKRGDSGNITCYAENEMLSKPENVSSIGKNTKSYFVSILYPPAITHLTEKQVVEGDDLIISCILTPGNIAEQTLVWTRNNDNITFNNTLTMPSVTRYFAGQITCNVNYTLMPTYGTYRKEEVFKRIYIDVLYKAEITTFYVQHSKQEGSVTVNENDTVHFVCIVDSNPSSTMDILFNNTVNVTDVITYKETKNLDHAINISRCTDTGVYVCSGKNNVSAGQPSTKQILLHVNCTPRKSPSMPIEFNISIAEHSETSFSYTVLAYPKPDFSLYRMDGPQLNTQLQWAYTISNKLFVEWTIYYTLTNVTSSMYGRYLLRVNNSIGESTHRFYLVSKAPVMKSEYSSIVGPAVGGALGGLLAIGAIAMALIFVRRRRMKKMSQEDKQLHEYQNMNFMKDAKQHKCLPPVPIEDSSDFSDRKQHQSHHVEATCPEKNNKESKMQQTPKEVKQNPDYQNMSLMEDANHNKRFQAAPNTDVWVEHHNHKMMVSDDHPDQRTVVKTQQKPKEVKQHSEYENMNLTKDAYRHKRLPQVIPTDDAFEIPDQVTDVDDSGDQNQKEILDIIHTISVSDLLSYVTSKTAEDYFQEYGRFPQGMISTIPYTFSRRPQNAPLNRYQGIYPYDHSRVVISGEPDFFINANYIDGHLKERAYIASLGPTVRHCLGFQTFWKMVWNEKSDVIVMLTNLQEPSGMKCEKYWADYGTTREVGDFTIQSVAEEVAAEYTVRTFNVSKKGESRSVTHLHFTAWPDKKVPEDVTSLIEFWQRVKAAPTRSLGPLVVHCSAGIGRTGTYLALDRLFQEGKTTGFVNVFDCVMSMRQQRVNMVQTQDQYVYLHRALVYCLVFDTEPVTADKIEEYVMTTSHNVYIKLFEQLKQTVEVESTYESEAIMRNCDDDERNRAQADIPGDTHRIRLFLDKESDESDYINAVYLNSFKRLGLFIIAQSPLPKTLDDFVLMLYQENCCCIVSLDDYQQKGTNNALYLPAENQHATYGTCTISSTVLDAKSAYTVRKLKIGHSSRFEKGMKIAHHFEYTGWKHDERIPKDVNMFVEFVQEVEEYATQLADEHSHVLVHCLTGSGRSGLFCAVSNMIQKMGQDRQVSVVNTLRQVRARRKTAIRNTEQLKFCYQSVYAFVKNYKV